MSEVVATQPHWSSPEWDGSHTNKAENRGSAGLGMRSEERVLTGFSLRKEQEEPFPTRGSDLRVASFGVV